MFYFSYFFIDLLEFLGGTLKPEIKLGRFRLKLRMQSSLNRMVMVRINARVIGRRTPFVARVSITFFTRYPRVIKHSIKSSPNIKAHKSLAVSQGLRDTGIDFLGLHVK